MLLRILLIPFLGTFILSAQETSDMSPFKDMRIPKVEDPKSRELETRSNFDPITGERIITLDPMTVRAGRSYEEIVEERIRKEKDDFKTNKTWAKQYRESLVDQFLNPRFLPRLGPSHGQIMKMYVNDQKLEKQIWMFNSTTRLKTRETMQMRFDLMNMKRNAIQLGLED